MILQIMEIILTILILIIQLFVAQYLNKKAENLATKQDLKEITTIAESTKASIASRLHTNKTRYDLELRILEELNEKIVNLKIAALSLRPIFDIETNQTDEKKLERRFNDYNEAARSLHLYREYKKPFYPIDLFNKLIELDKVTWTETVETAIYSRKHRDTKYWREAKENSDKIKQLSESAMESIRERIQYWEELFG